MERLQRRRGHRAARADASAYKIYYLPGFLAGPVASWPSQFERIVKLGFNQICLAPVGTPGRSGNIFVADDPDQVDRRLGGPQETRRLLADVAKSARAHGLGVLVDVALDRVAADGALARAHPELFHEPPATQAVLDPRADQPYADAALPRFDDPEAARILLQQWSGRLSRWAQAGVGGFRLLGLDHVPAGFVTELIGSVRDKASGCDFLG